MQIGSAGRRDSKSSNHDTTFHIERIEIMGKDNRPKYPPIDSSIISIHSHYTGDKDFL